MRALARGLVLAARRRPLDAALAAIAAGVCLYVVFAPLFAATYPPMTDLPFHAATTSALRHYLDPAWHFREQFTLQPFAAPYLSTYVLGALLMLALPAHVAVKIAMGVTLAMLPAGLAVLFHGMKKSPLLGLLGAGFVWASLSHWGFVNFMGACGLFAMTVGLTMRLVDAPSRGKQVGLAALLLVLFFTHVFRYPFALAAVAGTAIVLYPSTRRIRPVLWPLALGAIVFVAWMRVRPSEIGGSFGPLAVHAERLREIPSTLFGGLADAAEAKGVERALRVLLATAGVGLVALFAERRHEAKRARDWLWHGGASVVVLSCAAVFLGLFLVLPMQIGTWWYVYPREITAAAFVALGLFPDLPKNGAVRAMIVIAIAYTVGSMGATVARDYAQFEGATADYRAVAAKIPAAPKLMMLVHDHGGSMRSTTPFIHLPAWVQAERGGWLSFHFAIFGASPVRYRDAREPGAVVPPPVPVRWEWTPQLFDVNRHGAFFDWFLVRSPRSPEAQFRGDPSIVPVDHVGTWWLYRRDLGHPGPPSP
jgi:hypothetical protein